MAPHTDGGRGRLRAATASVALLLGGGGAVAWGLVNQNPDPPAPPPTSSGGAPSPSRQTAGPPSASSTDPAPSSTTDTAPADASGSPADSASASPSTSTTPEPSASAPSSPSATSSTSSAPATPTGAAAMPASEPASVRIGAIGVDAPVHPLGLNEDGTLAVPSGARYDEPAWYDGSPTPGEVGPSVIEGHVTGAGGRKSVFFELGALRPGDTVEVDRQDGTTATFEVDAVESYPKDQFPTASVYGPTERPELRVITCGGTVSAETGHHVDNVVVFAHLVD